MGQCEDSTIGMIGDAGMTSTPTFVPNGGIGVHMPMLEETGLTREFSLKFVTNSGMGMFEDPSFVFPNSGNGESMPLLEETGSTIKHSLIFSNSGTGASRRSGCGGLSWTWRSRNRTPGISIKVDISLSRSFLILIILVSRSLFSLRTRLNLFMHILQANPLMPGIRISLNTALYCSWLVFDDRDLYERSEIVFWQSTQNFISLKLTSSWNSSTGSSFTGTSILHCFDS